MNHTTTIEFPQLDDDIFAFNFSDEAIEAAAGISNGIEDTTQCTWSVTTLCNPCKE
ncbi:hypothetical protein [Mycobacterium attenuatum]|uniref:Uncharacterized protein n=1 Tax=Mycobacterium attenuatum TaxID=2341086 RepID=A0A498PVW3_9MYCO|nr:hypothetical protein [Mycobacterium attenuatum]VBA37091.1 hypothetical protein LAUMK136_01754 [Mycobacterium attenuatum]VBA49942.1 hypothetical protein LAUMK191_01743 [Mycobacterium attenuatum]VBA55591.1 hypothetical protein LAUMK41_01819 [Mycobacterium attenuatum]